MFTLTFDFVSATPAEGVQLEPMKMEQDVAPLLELDNDVEIFQLEQGAQNNRTMTPSFRISAEGERKNDYPIILVHGLMGFGREEAAGLLYWGGFRDIEAYLSNSGYRALTASIGAVSSNWDRACELYAQIKGGTVDYGEAHSKLHGHDRYGITYEGLYPEWGEINPETGEVNKVHLIGHSMGGQTIRVLTELLSDGHPEEASLTSADSISPLFTGGKSWVHSATSISTPHDGTSLLHILDDKVPFTRQLITLLAAFNGVIDNDLYDFQLEQWGLARGNGEELSSYFDRVMNSHIWDTSDISKYDLSPEGAKQLNSWVEAQPDVYYFSVANEQTYSGFFTGHHYPELFMNPLFAPTSYLMGKYTHNGSVNIDQSWWENDGLVSTVSMDKPSFGSSDAAVFYNGKAQIGKWNYLGVLSQVDHTDIVGIGGYDMRPWYRGLASLLGSLDTLDKKTE